MTAFIILPGIGDSGGDHWQTLWQAKNRAMRRLQPNSWDHPELTDWISSLDRAVDACATPPVLIAHSLSCLLVSIWQQASDRLAAGAFLVGVPDPGSPAYPAEAAGFANVPTDRFRFASMILASTNDPYGSVAYARSRAVQWGSELITLGALGHINGASGIGDWPEGKSYLNRFVSELAGS